MEIQVQIAQCHAASYKENNILYTSSSITAADPRIGLGALSAVGCLPLIVWITTFTEQGK